MDIFLDRVWLAGSLKELRRGSGGIVYSGWCVQLSVQGEKKYALPFPAEYFILSSDKRIFLHWLHSTNRMLTMSNAKELGFNVEKTNPNLCRKETA